MIRTVDIVCSLFIPSVLSVFHRLVDIVDKSIDYVYLYNMVSCGKDDKLRCRSSKLSLLSTRKMLRRVVIVTETLACAI
jgi:hypothetical protein